MTGLEVVQQLMMEIGPRLELSEVTEFTEDESWVLIVDDDTVVTADYDAAGVRVVFSTEVATPPAQNRYFVYEQLLVFNHQWPETGGLRFALDEPGGVAVMSFDLTLDGLDVQRLEESLGVFLEQLVVWRGQITEGVDGQADGEQAPPEQSAGPPPGMIQA